ncbi:MAG: DNA repair protein RecN [Alphaproteobacteria bacterium]
MLVSLSIRNVVLIDRAELDFVHGLCVLTGETGAGKSILLDSLGLALGMRANANLVRRAPGETEEPATVTATFELENPDPIATMLAEQEIEAPNPGEALVLRRVLDSEGRSRAFVNDQPVSVALLRRIGETLVEIEGQFASHGLMDPARHRAALDSFGGLNGARDRLGALYTTMRDAERALALAREAHERAREEEDFLRHAADELATLDPRSGEEDELAATRSLLMNGEKLIEALSSADKALTDGNGVEDRVNAALRTLTRRDVATGAGLDPVLDALQHAGDGIADALSALRQAMIDAEPDPQRLERSEERLFALRAAARKHDTTVEALPDLRDRFARQLAALDDSGERLAELEGALAKARDAYVKAAQTLSAARAKQAKKLDKAVTAELPPLRLEKARFSTLLETLKEPDWGPAGIDRVHFEVATNPGTPGGPLGRIASGGELARFLLALKVVLRRSNATPTLIFDEVDSGIGGATAAAVGDRLARLAEEAQVLVITHSPQVASCGRQHLVVAKSNAGGTTTTHIDDLGADARLEEIARMLAGASVTDEARAAAAMLMAGDQP